VDIHCVTKWSKLDTSWSGVSLDALLGFVDTSAKYVLAFCDGGYTANLPLEDLSGGKAWIAYQYDGEPLSPEHGGPARLLVPHLYFWKSAKWVRGIELRDSDEPGFWERYGYHNYGDPLERAALSGGLSVARAAIVWRLASVVGVIVEAARQDDRARAGGLAGAQRGPARRRAAHRRGRPTN
jgi:DMSO/TMAO reductase YedYZ molybdopterin-dependent catalytic subunit